MSQTTTLENNISGLNLPKGLWLCIAYGLRHFLFVLTPAAISYSFENYYELFSSRIFLVSDCIVLIVTYFYTLQDSTSSNNAKKTWVLFNCALIAAYLTDLASMVSAHLAILLNSSSGNFNLVIGSMLIDLGAIVYLIRSMPAGNRSINFPLLSDTKDSVVETVQNLPAIKINRTTTNIPDIVLTRKPIAIGYEFADFPFPHGATGNLLVYIRSHLLNNKLKTAEKGLRYLLKKEPQNAEYWHELALVAFASDKLDQAEALILKALLFEANNYLYWRNLGEIRRRMGHPNDAIQDLQKALELNPNDINSLYNLGLALSDAKKPDEAREIFELAIKIHPENTKRN